MTPRAFAARLFPQPRTIRRKPAVKTRESSFLRSRLEQLEDRITPVTNNWTGTTSLNWSIASNWSLNHTPTDTEDVQIGTGDTVSHSANTDTVHKISITGGSTLVLSGGSITDSTDLDASSGSFMLSGGTLSSATLLAGSTITGTTAASGTLDGVTINGTLDMATNIDAIVNVTGGLTLGPVGLVQLGSSDGKYALLNFAGGNQTLGGSGSVVFGSSLANALRPSVSGTALTIGPNILIHGQSGAIGYHSNNWGGPTDVTFTNQGTINADGPGNLTLDGLNWSNANTGIIEATAGGTVTLARSWTNSGNFNVATNSTLNLGGTFATSTLGTITSSGTVNLTGTLTNAASTLTLNASTGSWRLGATGTIDGGTVATTGGAALTSIDGGGGMLANGVTIDGTLDLGTNGNPTLNVTGGLTLSNGLVNIGNSGGNYALLNFAGGNQTLGGSGTVVFGSSLANALRPSVSGTALTIGPNILIDGQSGAIGYHSNNWGGPTDVTFTNQGTIRADVSGGRISLDGLNWSNAGSIQAQNGGTVTLARSWTNSGTIASAADSTLNLGGTFATSSLGTITNSGTVNLTGALTNDATLTLNDATGSWQLLGGTIDGGTIATTGSNALIATYNGFNGGLLANGVTLNGALDMTTNSGANVSVTGGLTLAGGVVLQLGSSTGNYALLNFAGGSQTLGGSGSVVFGNSQANALRPSLSGTALTIGPNILVHGQSGAIGYHSNNWGGPTDVTFTNQGTISADVSGGTITLDGLNWSNTGSIQAQNGGTITLARSWTNSGAFDVAAGSTLNLGGTFAASTLGTINSAGATVNLTGILANTASTLTLNDTTGSWQLLGGTIDGGTIATTGSNALIATYNGFNGGLLANGVTLTGRLDMVTNNAANVMVTGGLTLGAGVVLQLGSGAGNAALLNFAGGSQTLGGSGIVVFGSSQANALRPSLSGTALTIGPNILVRGQSGGIGYHSNNWGGPSDVTFTNQGTISADVAGGIITLNGLNWSNVGTVQAQNGGTIVNAGTNANYSGGTLTGGTWKVFDNSVLRNIGGNIATNAATIVLDGGNSNVYSDTGTANALATLVANVATGSLTIRNGRNVALAGAFTNFGSLNVGAGCQFAVGFGQYASSAIAFSSQYTTSNWSVIQTLGPSNTSSYGDVATSWAPLSQNGTQEFLTLGFANPGIANGVIIRETDGNGFVTQIDAIDTSDVVHPAVWSGTDPSLPGSPVDFLASWPTTSYAIKAVKIYVNTDHNLATWEELDSVQLVGSFASYTQAAGSTTIDPGATLTLSQGGDYRQTGGSTTVNGSLATTGLVDIQGGLLQGGGTVNGSLRNAALVAPGPGTAALTVNGDYTQAATGALNVEIGGLAAGTQYDQLSVSGSVALDGGLTVTRIGGFVPAIGDSFRFIDQTGGGSVGATFAGLAEGSTFFADSNSRFSIAFAGGNGNDVILTAINIAPTLDAIPDPSSILEDAGQQTINLAGVAAGGVETQTLTVTAVSSNPGLIPNPSVTYSSPNATGLLSYTPVANQSGTAVITVTVTDDGGTANGGINTFIRTFTVTVLPVNDAPTLDAISDPAAILEDAGQQTFNLTGILAGGGESQALTVTATSSNPALIPNPAVIYTSANATGSLSYTPVNNISGTATITVTVTDNGGTANGGVNTFTRTFTVTVLPVNDIPTLDAISDPAAILEDAGPQTIDLTGISAGGGESQTLTVTATSSNPSLIPDPSVIYTSADSTGSLTYSPSGILSGSAIITVTVTDNGGTTNGGVNTFIRTFTVVVAPYNHELVSTVNPLPLVSAPFFPVSWSGSVTSGTSVLAAFDIFVSTDGGPYTLWQHNTVATTAIFTGALGKDYRFYSIATDTVGGREHPPATPDAETQTALFQRDLPPITEDSKNPASVSVSTLLGTAMTDADAGARRGIAVTGTSGSGSWQFSTTGSSWTTITSASEDAAWLLPDSYRLRFLPAANFVGKAGLVFRGWDQTWGTPGKKIAIVTGESASPVSEAGGFVQVIISPVNDRPVLPAAPAPRLFPTPRSPVVPVGQAVSALVRAATDVDGDVLGAAVIAKTGTGDWQFSLNGGSTWTSMGSVTATSALLLGPTDLVRFVPTASATGSATLTVKAWDRTNGQAGNRVNTTVPTNLAFSSGTTVATTLINGAPTLSGTNPTLTMSEDQSPNSGFLVSVLTAGRFSDDAGALAGIAMTSADGLGHGAWQYSTNGTTWTTIGTVSDSNALLLRSTDRIRFIPNADFNGTTAATLTFKAWDQTSGTAGTVADVSAFAAGTFFSSASLNATLNISSVADRPVVDTSVTPALDSFLPAGSPSSARILDLLGNSIHDPDSPVGPIAITSTTGTGTWEFSLDGGATWSAIGVIPTASGRLLDGDSRIRFNASAAFHGVATFRFKAWDGTGGTVGSIAAIPAASTAFSTLIGTTTVAVNVAPVLNPSSPVPFPAIAEDAKNPAGATVSSILGSSISDPDGATALRGIAVTALTGTNDGAWQFSTNGGTNWNAVGAVSDSAALLLRSTDKLRFLPAANFHGQATATFRAWDQTTGAFGKLSDASINGGSSAFSTATRTSTVNVIPVNDAPATRSGYLKGKIHLPSVVVGATSPAGVKVGDLVAAGVVDVDGDGLGIAVSGLTGTTKGQWQYSVNGTNWLNIGTVSATSALLLASADFIRFVPNAGFNGSAQLKFRAWDQTKGVAHTHKPLTSSALAGSLSSTDSIALVWVNSDPILTTN